MKIVIFDIDNTLTESRQKASAGISRLLSNLIDKVPVALISGESFEDFKYQVIDGLSCNKKENLYALPTSGAELQIYQSGDWKKAYSFPLSDLKRHKIFTELAKTLGIAPTALGDYVYDRGNQITYTALGKNAPLDQKYAWDPTHERRSIIVEKMRPNLPGLSITIGGSTSIDFTEQGIDKAFGVKNIIKYLNISAADVVFVGDALGHGGNDEPVKALGVKAISTTGPENTKKIIQELLNEI